MTMGSQIKHEVFLNAEETKLRILAVYIKRQEI